MHKLKKEGFVGKECNHSDSLAILFMIYLLYEKHFNIRNAAHARFDQIILDFNRTHIISKWIESKNQ